MSQEKFVHRPSKAETPVAEYTIDTKLYAQALEELADNWRRKTPRVPESVIQEDVKNIFSHAWHLAIQHHEQVVPDTAHEIEEPESFKKLMARTNLSPKMRESLEKSRQKMAGSRSDINQMMLDKHRAGLIELFTMDEGVSQSTAEKIIDNHILIHKK